MKGVLPLRRSRRVVVALGKERMLGPLALGEERRLGPLMLLLSFYSGE